MRAERTLGSLERVLARVALLLLLCGLAAAAVRSEGSWTHTRDREGRGRAGGGPPLAEGQALVSGTATSLAADAQTVDVVPAPFTGEAPSVAIEGALVDGQRSAIVWNGGRPFVLEGAGPALEASPTHVELAPDAVTVTLDGTPRPLLAGNYRLAAPVAVGTGGLATPRDGVAFTADRETMLTASGRIRTGARPLRLSGPGSVSAMGQFTVRTNEGEHPATTVVFGPGPFDVAASPVAGGWTVTATLQGPLRQG